MEPHTVFMVVACSRCGRWRTGIQWGAGGQNWVGLQWSLGGGKIDFARLMCALCATYVVGIGSKSKKVIQAKFRGSAKIFSWFFETKKPNFRNLFVESRVEIGLRSEPNSSTFISMRMGK